MRDKAAVGADLYIEDSVGNIEALRTDEKGVVAYITSQNRGLVEPPYAEDWEECERLILEEVEEWEKRQESKPASRLAGS